MPQDSDLFPHGPGRKHFNRAGEVRIPGKRRYSLLRDPQNSCDLSNTRQLGNVGFLKLSIHVLNRIDFSFDNAFFRSRNPSALECMSEMLEALLHSLKRARSHERESYR